MLKETGRIGEYGSGGGDVSLPTLFRRLKQQAPPLIQVGLLSTYCVLAVFLGLEIQKGRGPLHSHVQT